MHKRISLKPKCILHKDRLHTSVKVAVVVAASVVPGDGRPAADWSTRWWRERASCTEVCPSSSRKAGPRGSRGKPADTTNTAGEVSEDLLLHCTQTSGVPKRVQVQTFRNMHDINMYTPQTKNTANHEFKMSIKCIYFIITAHHSNNLVGDL